MTVLTECESTHWSWYAISWIYFNAMCKRWNKATDQGSVCPSTYLFFSTPHPLDWLMTLLSDICGSIFHKGSKTLLSFCLLFSFFSLRDRKLLSLCDALQWWWLTRVWPVEKTTTSELRAEGNWGPMCVCLCVWTTQTLVTRGWDHMQERLCSAARILVPHFLSIFRSICFSFVSFSITLSASFSWSHTLIFAAV